MRLGSSGCRATLWNSDAASLRQAHCRNPAGYTAVVKPSKMSDQTQVVTEVDAVCVRTAVCAEAVVRGPDDADLPTRE
jgi:hypothetical protein